MQDPHPQQRQKMDIKISGLSGGTASCISGEDVCWWWSECISALRALDLVTQMEWEDSKEDSPPPHLCMTWGRVG